MDGLDSTPLISLGNIYHGRRIYAKCEFLALSGCFKIRGAEHLIRHLERTGGARRLVVPSMGNTALGAAVAAHAHGFGMTGVVPETISGAKDERLRALGVELVKLNGGGSELLSRAAEISSETGGYFVHPHLDPHWTDGYQAILDEILQELPDCRTVVFPLGGGGLLLGLEAARRRIGCSVQLLGCEPQSYAKYASDGTPRTGTIADGLRLERPHPPVQETIAAAEIAIALISEAQIRVGLRSLCQLQGLLVEPSSAITLGALNGARPLPEPVCLILTGANIAPEDHRRLMRQDEGGAA